VAEDKLGSSIQDALGVTCQRSGPVQELLRGIRLHFTKMIKELREGDLEKAQLSLGHHYSRAKVKFNIHRVDNMIIQSISLLDQLDKDVNTFSMRVREWYSWHFPEMVKIVPDNYMFAQLVKLIKDKTNITEDIVEQITTIVGDPDKAKEVYDAAKTSMGTDISEIDLKSIEDFTERVIHLTEYRQKLQQYLQKKMNDCAPNLSALMGESLGARLVARAGSLTNLAKFPASTVQILGAEKALFRALKTKGNTPKYGLIFASSFIQKANQKNKGRISRYLANKASLASRIDSFTENPGATGGIFGQKLKEQLEERMIFYEKGTKPRKNIDVMREALKEVGALGGETMEVDGVKKVEKEKKDKKRKKEESESEEEEKQEKKKSKKDKKEKKDKKKKKDESESDEEEKKDKKKKDKKDKKEKKEKKDKKKDKKEK
jgi:nucleolar protein 56